MIYFLKNGVTDGTRILKRTIKKSNLFLVYKISYIAISMHLQLYYIFVNDQGI